jgi:hypothetical protein
MTPNSVNVEETCGVHELGVSALSEVRGLGDSDVSNLDGCISAFTVFSAAGVNSLRTRSNGFVSPSPSSGCLPSPLEYRKRGADITDGQSYA